MKYRLAIQRFDDDGRPVEFRNVMLESKKSIDFIKGGVLQRFSHEYYRWLEPFLNRLNDLHSKKAFAERFGLGTDLFDSAAVGNDISEEEFIENELFFELHQ